MRWNTLCDLTLTTCPRESCHFILPVKKTRTQRLRNLLRTHKSGSHSGVGLTPDYPFLVLMVSERGTLSRETLFFIGAQSLL